jgi:hypothetical protein
MDLVLIEWQDSRQPSGGWQWLDECDTPAPVKCLTVGWLLKKTKDALLIAQSLGDVAGERMQFSGGTEIARRSVIRMEKLDSPV